MRPRFSWTTGPSGISFRTGGDPRVTGTVLQIKLGVLLRHSQGGPKIPFRAIPATRWARAEAKLMIHRLRPASSFASLMLTKAISVPSADQRGNRILAFG